MWRQQPLLIYWCVGSGFAQYHTLAPPQDERAALEEKVTKQLEAERRALLAKKRAQQEERRRKADDLERILQENQRKVHFRLHPPHPSSRICHLWP